MRTLIRIALFVLAPALAAAQSPAIVDVVVLDSSGSPVADAAVTLTDAATRLSVKGRTAADGTVRLEAVEGTSYLLLVARDGFAPFRQERVAVTAQVTGPLRVTLEVSGLREEVTVVARSPLMTATGVDVPLRDTPITGSAIRAEFVAQQGAHTVSTALRNVAGAHARVDYGLYESYTFRGTSGDLDNVLLVDGIRQEGNRNSSQLGHIERIEVLRGPASVLYGSDAFGGAVNLVRKKPQVARAHELSAAFGSWQDLRFDGGTTGTLRPSLLYRLDVGGSTADGWRGTNARRLSASPSLTWFPDAQSQLAVHYTFIRNAFRPDGGTPLNLVHDSSLPSDRRLNTPNDFALIRDHNLQATYSRQLTSRSQIENTLVVRQYDDEYFAAESYEVTSTGIDRSALYFLHDRPSLMNRVKWSLTANLPQEHRFLVGHEYQRYTNDTDRSAFVSVTPLDRLTLEETEPARDRLSTARWIRFRQNVHAVYAQDHVDVTSRFKVLAGFRVDRFDRWSRTDPVTDGITTLGPVTTREMTALTGRAGAVLQAHPTYTLYGSVSTAFRPNLQVPADGSVLEPERGRQVEVGQRLELLRGRLASNIAVYELVKRNVTFARIGNLFDQAGRVRARGFEIDVEARPTASALVSFNFSHTDATFIDFFAGSTDLTGRRPRNVPRQTANLWATQELGRLSVAVGAQYVGRAFADNTNLVTYGNYALVDAAIAWRLTGGELRLNITNLLDRRDYFTTAIYDTQLYRGAPRAALLSYRITM